MVYVPAHTFLPTKNGNENEFDVPDRIVKEGVVNITVLELLQWRPSGPDSVNFTLTVCGAVMQSMTLLVTLTNAGRFTDLGLRITEA